MEKNSENKQILLVLKGIGRKTADDIISIYPDLELLCYAIESGKELPFRDDVTEILKQNLNYLKAEGENMGRKKRSETISDFNAEEKPAEDAKAETPEYYVEIRTEDSNLEYKGAFTQSIVYDENEKLLFHDEYKEGRLIRYDDRHGINDQRLGSFTVEIKDGEETKYKGKFVSCVIFDKYGAPSAKAYCIEDKIIRA